MARTRLGFDVGSGSIKIAAVRGDSTRLETVRLPENLADENGVAMPNAFSQFLKQTMKQLRLPRGEGTLVLPPSQVICRLVTMPRMTTQQLMMNLPYEFTDFIQGVPDQYFCDYALCERGEGEDGNSLTMMAAVASKRQIEGYIRMFARAGVRVKTLLPPEMALIELVRRRREKGGAEEYCFVDLGRQYTRITVVWRDRVQATRQIALAGRHLDQAIADELGVDMFRAETYRAENRPDVLSIPAVEELCGRLAVEILKVVNFYQFSYRSSELPGIYLSGGGAAFPPLREAIAARLSLPLLDPAQLLPGLSGEKAAAGIIAAGAAVGGCAK